MRNKRRIAAVAIMAACACGGRAPQISTPEAYGPADGGPAVATIPSGGVAGPGNARDAAAELEAGGQGSGSSLRRTGTTRP